MKQLDRSVGGGHFHCPSERPCTCTCVDKAAMLQSNCCWLLPKVSFFSQLMLLHISRTNSCSLLSVFAVALDCPCAQGSIQGFCVCVAKPLLFSYAPFDRLTKVDSNPATVVHTLEGSSVAAIIMSTNNCLRSPAQSIRCSRQLHRNCRCKTCFFYYNCVFCESTRTRTKHKPFVCGQT